MKIDGSNKTSGSRGISKTGAKKGVGGFDALLDETAETEARPAPARTAAVGALESLLALQGAEDSTSEEATRKAKKRAADLLDHLDRVRVGLLDGHMPESALQQLTQMIAGRRESVLDPKLAEILDEIDLRAQVELAKLSRE